MYETFWQLNQKPFENGADSRFYYPGESHQAALLKLRYAIENRRGGALLAGPSGTGKTLLAAMLPGVLSENCSPVVRLAFPLMSTAELLGYLADELEGGVASNAETSVSTSVRRIQNFLDANSRQDRHAVAVIDEAHLTEDSGTFEALRMLMDFGHGGAASITILLAGQVGIFPMLERMPQLEERLDVKCLLRPFNEAETGGYVEHRLRAAGAARQIVDSGAIAEIHALSQGIPRRINRLCDLALLIGFAEEQRMLKAEHFDAVCRELASVSPE